MDTKLACEIVKDLLPLYVDKMVSDVSQKSIEQHLQQCTDCMECYQNMAVELESSAQTPEVSDIKRFLKKTKRMYFFYGLCGLSFLSIFVCLIVDLALNKGITWSLIVGSAVLFADILVYVLSACKKNKGCITMAVLSIGTGCLLSVIQFTRYYLMNTGTVWIFRYGFPILLVWLGVLWLPLLFRTVFKWNLWDCIAFFLFLVIVGNYFTKCITGDFVWRDIFYTRDFIINALGEAIGILVFGAIGRVKKWRR